MHTTITVTINKTIANTTTTTITLTMVHLQVHQQQTTGQLYSILQAIQNQKYWKNRPSMQLQQPNATAQIATNHYVAIILNSIYAEAQLDYQNWPPSAIATTMFVHVVIHVHTTIITTKWYVHVHWSYQVAPDAITNYAATTNIHKTTI